MELTKCYCENEFAQFWIQNRILFLEYKPNVVIDLKAAQQIVGDLMQIQNEKGYPVFCDMRGIVAIDKAARDYFAQSSSVLTKAVGLLGNQSISLTLTSFYLKICKPKMPTRFFTDKAAALAFLESYI
jgi:hypothetical protein